MERIVIYCRVSTEEQHQLDALERQIEALTAFVKTRTDWVLVDTYVDRGKSGTSTVGRNGYNKLYVDLESDKFDTVVVKDESRLARNTLDWQLFKKRAVMHDKNIYFYLKNEYYSYKTDLYLNINAAMAEHYSRDLSRKILEASEKAQRKGTIYGNSRIYGYTKDNGKLVVDEEEARVVRHIFDLYIAGNGFRVIQGILTSEGIYSTTGEPFSLSTMKRMIQQEKYTGVIVSHKTFTDFDKKRLNLLPETEWIKIYDPERCPPIITREVFDKANEILNSRRQENGADKAKLRGAFRGNNYPLSGKIICGECGQVFWHEHYLTKKNKLPRNKWHCSRYKSYGTKVDNKGCSNIRLEDEQLMGMLREVLCELINSDDVKAVVDLVNNTAKKEKRDYESEIRNLKAKVNRLEKRKSNLVNNLADGLITREEFVTAKQQAVDEIAAIEKAVMELESKHNDEEEVGIDKKILDFLNLAIDKPAEITDNIIKDIVDKIVVDENKLDLYIAGNKQELNVSSLKKSPCVVNTGANRTHTQIYSVRKLRTTHYCPTMYLYFFVYI